MRTPNAYHVSSYTEPNGDGALTVTFETLEEAQAYAFWAKSQGLFDVTIWA